MAFPTTAVLDDFTRANNADLGTNWTVLSTYGTLNVISNTAGPSTTAARGEYWNVGNFGPDCEVYFTISTMVTNNGNNFDLMLRVTTESGAWDGYDTEMTWSSAGTDQVGIYRADNGVLTQLGASIGQNFATGEKIGLEAIGSTIAVYRFASAAWSQLGTRTDATYNTAGKIAFFCDHSSGRMDDFGGGTVVVAAGSAAGSLGLLGVGR